MEAPKNNDRSKSRRDFLKILGMGAAGAAASAPVMMVAKKFTDAQDKEFEAKRKLDEENTHFGKAVVLEKIPTSGSGSIDLPINTFTGLGTGGLSGGVGGFIEDQSLKAMKGPHDWQLRVQVDDHAPMVIHVFQGDYEHVHAGDSIDAEYITDPDTKAILPDRVRLHVKYR